LAEGLLKFLVFFFGGAGTLKFSLFDIYLSYLSAAMPHCK
jgi:hypothetical protein